MPTEHLEWIRNPKIYEINTWPWLRSLSDRFNSPITLQNIPDEIFNKEINLFDAVWLMGVWERSPASRKIALERPDLQKEFHKALHELRLYRLELLHKFLERFHSIGNYKFYQHD